MTFFDGYSYKQKNYALALLAVLLLAVSYKRAFSVTIDTIKNKEELILKTEEARNALNNIRVVQSQIASLNKLLGKENITIEKVQQGFLNFLNMKSSHVYVYQVEEVLKYQHPDFSINTHRIILRGNFLNTLQFLYKLEKEFDLAKLVNVSFEYKKYNMEEREQLYTVILLQNYQR